MVRPHPMSSHDFLSDKYVTNGHFSKIYFETTFSPKANLDFMYNASFLGFRFLDFGGGN